MTQLINWLTQHGLSYLIIGLSIFWPGYFLGVKAEKWRDTGYDGAEIITGIMQIITGLIILVCILKTLFS